MSSTKDFEGVIATWLAEAAPAAAPAGLHHRAIERARHARQRLPWWAALREITVGERARQSWFIALLAAVVALTVLAGALLFSGFGRQPSPASSLSPSPSPVVTTLTTGFPQPYVAPRAAPSAGSRSRAMSSASPTRPHLTSRRNRRVAATDTARTEPANSEPSTASPSPRSTAMGPRMRGRRRPRQRLQHPRSSCSGTSRRSPPWRTVSRLTACSMVAVQSSCVDRRHPVPAQTSRSRSGR